MCLTRIYVNNQNEENCVMEEAARVETSDKGVTAYTLFEEKKILNSYSVNTVNFMDNIVMLKKIQHKHDHEHSHHHSHSHSHNHNDKEYPEGDTPNEKIRTLLPYLLAHNQGHIEEIEKWTEKVKSAGYQKAAQELEAAIALFGTINKHFDQALNWLDQEG